MHPPLIPEKHPLCKEFIEALVRCHSEHSVAKWWGACNDAKFDLTRCFAEEKKILRHERQERARQQYRASRARQDAQQQQQEQQQQQQQQQQ